MYEIRQLIKAFYGTASYYLERHYRHRREIARLYRPLDAEEESSDSEDDALLPSYRQQSTSSARKGRANGSNITSPGIRLGNVWDEADHTEIFAITDDDDDDLTPGPSKPANGSLHPPNGALDASGRRSPIQAPKIVVSPPQEPSPWT